MNVVGIFIKMERLEILKANEHKFWISVKKDSPDLCWIWGKYKNKGGYGDFQFSHFSKHYNYQAHRASYELTNGAIPNNLIVCHKCDNPSCVNPNHLFVGTHKDNQDDKVKKGRQALGENNGSSKLNWLSVKEIRTKYKSGVEVKELSKHYKICKYQIRDILKNKHWIDKDYQGVTFDFMVFKKGHTFKRILSDEKVKEIKMLINEGVKPKKISEITGIKNQKIKDIKRGVAYFNIKL